MSNPVTINTISALDALPDVRCIVGDFTEKLARTREMIGLANRKKTELEILARIYENAVKDLQGIAADDYEENEPPFDPDTLTETPPPPDDLPETIEDVPEAIEEIPFTESEPVPPSEDLWPDFPEDDWK